MMISQLKAHTVQRYEAKLGIRVGLKALNISMKCKHFTPFILQSTFKLH